MSKDHSSSGGLSNAFAVNERFDAIVRIEGTTTGLFDADFLEGRRARRHLYQMDWQTFEPPSEHRKPIGLLCSMGRTAAGVPIRSAEPQATLGSVEAIILGPRVRWCQLDELSVLTCLLTVIQSCESMPRGIWTLSTTVVPLSPADIVRPTQMGVWGLCRAVRTEEPSTQVRCADAGTGLSKMIKPGGIELAERIGVVSRLTEPEVAMRAFQIRVSRLIPAKNASTTTAPVRPTPPEQSTQLITGGTGSIGLLVAGWLAACDPQAHLLLTSRSGWLNAEALENVRACGTAAIKVSSRKGDTLQKADILMNLALAKKNLPPIRGLWHVTGVLADALIGLQNAETLSKAYEPKTRGAWLMSQTHVSAPLWACVYFASVAGIVGNGGQSNYAAANSCLDALAFAGRAQGRNAVSVAWGPWAQVGNSAGMAGSGHVNTRMKAMGLGLINAWQGLAALQAATQPSRPGSIVFWAARWDKFLGKGRNVPAIMKRLAPKPPPDGGASGYGASQAAPSPARKVARKTKAAPAIGLSGVLELVTATAGSDVDADQPLMEAGIDSLGAVELRNQLQGAAGEATTLPSTLILDFPTVRQIANHFSEIAAEAGGGEMMVCEPPGVAPTPALGLDTVLAMVQTTAGSDIDADQPLMEAGIDSLGSVELRNQLQGAVGESVQLPSTLVLDYPTARQLLKALTPDAPVAVARRKVKSKVPKTQAEKSKVAYDPATRKQGMLTLENEQSEALGNLLNNVPRLLAQTAQVAGNRPIDLHPVLDVLPKAQSVRGLKGMVCVISGASRGLGQGIAVRFGKGGAKVAVLGRSDGKVSWGPGTLTDVVGQINNCGGEGLAVPCDMGKPSDIDKAVNAIVEKWGSIDVLVNNASAHYTMGVEQLDMKRFDLMNNLGVRGTFLLTRGVLPHMHNSALPHVLNIAPAPVADKTWIGWTTCYSTAKIAMGMLCAAWSLEFPHVHFNGLWPLHAVATLAITNTFQMDIGKTVTVAHVGDACYRVVTSDSFTGFYRDGDLLASTGVTDFGMFKVDPKKKDLTADFMIDAEGFKKQGQTIEYISIPRSGRSLDELKGANVLLVGVSECTRKMAEAATKVGATVRVVERTTDAKKIATAVEGFDMLSFLFISAAPSSDKGTLETDADHWNQLYDDHLKAPNFFMAKCVPLLRKSMKEKRVRPRVVIVAPAPINHPESFAAPAVPAALLSQMCGSYVVGMSEEFNGAEVPAGHGSDADPGRPADPDAAIDVNAVWDGKIGKDPAPAKCLELLACKEPGTGSFYAADVRAIPRVQKECGSFEYTEGKRCVDFTTKLWLEGKLTVPSSASYSATLSPCLYLTVPPALLAHLRPRSRPSLLRRWGLSRLSTMPANSCRR